MSAKGFAEKLNYCLDQTDAPAQVRDRAVILSKMLDISKQQAWSLIEGQQIPDPTLLQKIANEFEVDPQWFANGK